MALEEVVNEHFLARYRAMLDAEDAAFDELEHAFEDGDRGATVRVLKEQPHRLLRGVGRGGAVAEPVAEHHRRRGTVLDDREGVSADGLLTDRAGHAAATP